MRQQIRPGDRFGRWGVLEATTKRDRYGYIRWACLCDCGSPGFVSTRNLRSGESTSCGCFRKERAAAANIVNLAGRTHGWLTVLSDSGRRSRARNVLWRCRCVCGEDTFVETRHLNSGNTASCGCALRQKEVRVRPHAVANANRLYQTVRRARMHGAAGTFTEQEIEALYEKQDGRCAACKTPVAFRHIHRDHVVPLALGGSNDISNIQVLCGPCNRSKGARDPISWSARNGPARS